MQTERRNFLAVTLFSALSIPSHAQSKSDSSPDSNDDAPTVSLRGRVVCLTEELQKRFNVEPVCADRHHVYALKTVDHKLHPFLPTESAAAVWMDERFRQRELQLTARRFPQSDFIEAIKFQSWQSARLHDLYYYCDICAITTFKPGPCECCQEPVEFRETPVKENQS